MNIRIDRSNQTSIRRQLSEQIVFLIASSGLKAGDALPSVRELASRLKVSPNTVSAAYRDLVARFWIKRHRGKKMVVRAFGNSLETERAPDLDDLIDATVRCASSHGYTLQDLRNRMQERFLIEHPNHVLIVEEEPEMRKLLHEELLEGLHVSVKSISIDALALDSGPAIGALVVSLPGRMWRIAPLLPRGHPMFALEPAVINAQLKRIRDFRKASLIGVVSISPLFLELARALLAPFAGNIHAIEEYLFDGKTNMNLSELDIVFCDSVASRSIQLARAMQYGLISNATMREISNRFVLGGRTKGSSGC